MKLSMGMTKAAVLPEPWRVFRVSIKSRIRYLTSLSNANDITILQTNGNGLPLNGGRFFVANLIDNFKDLGWNGGFLPGPQGMGD